MPSILALILCAGFVLYMLWLDREQAPELSWSIWVPTLWMLSIASKPMAAWFMMEAADPEYGSPLDQYSLLALFSLGLLTLAWRKFDWLGAVKTHTWLMVLICYMLLSIFWSDNLLVSFKRWIREFIAVIMAFLVLTEADPRGAMQSIFRRTIYILVPFSVILVKYYPEYGVLYSKWQGAQTWIGVTMQKNGLGRLCIIAVIFLVWTIVRKWRGSDVSVNRYQAPAEVLILIMALWMLKGPENAYSATAIGTLSVGLFSFACLVWTKVTKMNLRANAVATVISLIILFGTVTVFVGGSTVGAFTSILGREETLTGRTEIWAEILPIAKSHLIIGTGFGSFWTIERQLLYSESHSGYLDVLLNTGLIGLLLLSMFLLSTSNKAQGELEHDFDWAALWICFLVMTVIHNIAESSLSSFTSHLTAIILFFSVSFKKAESDVAEDR